MSDYIKYRIKIMAKELVTIFLIALIAGCGFAIPFWILFVGG